MERALDMELSVGKIQATKWQKPHELRDGGTSKGAREPQEVMLTGTEQARGGGQKGGGVHSYIARDIHVWVRRWHMTQEALKLLVAAFPKLKSTLNFQFLICAFNKENFNSLPNTTSVNWFIPPSFFFNLLTVFCFHEAVILLFII